METGIATYEFRHLPIFGDQSWFNANAAECAGEQGAFWPWHDELMTGSSAPYSRDGALRLAARFELDAAEFGRCLDEGRHLARVDQLARAAANAGARSTPSVFVDGRLIQPLSVEAVIEAATGGAAQ